jgi:hypothetical protein
MELSINELVLLAKNSLNKIQKNKSGFLVDHEVDIKKLDEIITQIKSKLRKHKD